MGTLHEQDLKVLKVFFEAAIRALNEGKMQVQEVPRSELSSEVGEHSLPVCMGYQFIFRDCHFQVKTVIKVVSIDTVDLGYDVVSSCDFGRLVASCAERMVMQKADEEFAARQRELREQQEQMRKKYGPLAEKIRGYSERVVRPVREECQ